ncbi:hypothetical protein HK102_004967 [Quaeritorhiza haematococci]|nr:hypothetical protein HK102_004967 [Quaeritorhiza haematococci]
MLELTSCLKIGDNALVALASPDSAGQPSVTSEGYIAGGVKQQPHGVLGASTSQGGSSSSGSLSPSSSTSSSGGGLMSFSIFGRSKKTSPKLSSKKSPDAHLQTPTAASFLSPSPPPPVPPPLAILILRDCRLLTDAGLLSLAHLGTASHLVELDIVGCPNITLRLDVLRILSTTSTRLTTFKFSYLTTLHKQCGPSRPGTSYAHSSTSSLLTSSTSQTPQQSSQQQLRRDILECFSTGFPSLTHVELFDIAENTPNDLIWDLGLALGRMWSGVGSERDPHLLPGYFPSQVTSSSVGNKNAVGAEKGKNAYSRTLKKKELILYRQSYMSDFIVTDMYAQVQDKSLGVDAMFVERFNKTAEAAAEAAGGVGGEEGGVLIVMGLEEMDGPFGDLDITGLTML